MRKMSDYDVKGNPLLNEIKDEYEFGLLHYEEETFSKTAKKPDYWILGGYVKVFDNDEHLRWSTNTVTIPKQYIADEIEGYSMYSICSYDKMVFIRINRTEQKFIMFEYRDIRSSRDGSKYVFYNDSEYGIFTDEEHLKHQIVDALGRMFNIKVRRKKGSYPEGYIPDEGDNNHPVGDFDKIYRNRLTFLKSMGYTEEDMYRLANEFKFSRNVRDVLVAKSDEDLFKKNYAAWREIREVYGDKWNRREARYAKEGDKSQYRTCLQTAKDLIIDSFIEQLLVSDIKNDNEIKIERSDERTGFNFNPSATTEPDFKINGGEYQMEMKISHTKTHFRNDSVFVIERLKEEFTKYRKYKDNLLFLRIESNNKKFIVLRYDEFDDEGVAKFDRLRVKYFNNPKEFGEQLTTAVREAIELKK